MNDEIQPIFGPLDEAVYHATPAVSSGLLRLFADPHTGPSDARLKLLATEDTDSDALRIGRAIHLLLLEPERAGEIVVQPRKPSKRDKEASRLAAQWGFAEPRRQLVLGTTEHEHCTGAARAVAAAIKPFVEAASEQWAEQAAFWVDAGLLCKAKPDLLLRMPSGRLVCIDAKSTSRGVAAWRRDALRRKVVLQAAHYTEGILQVLDGVDTTIMTGADLEQHLLWIFAAVEVQPPHRVRLYEVRGDVLRVALDCRDELLEDLAERMRSGDWSDRDEGTILDLCDVGECRRSLTW